MMKKRCFGLLALTLCMMIAMMPVAMSAVTPWGIDWVERRNGNDLLPVTLLAGGEQQLKFDRQGNLGLALKIDGQDPIPLAIGEDGSFSIPAKENGFYRWVSHRRMFGENDRIELAVESLPSPVIEVDGSKPNQKIIGFEGITYGFHSSGYAYAQEKVLKDFEAAFQKEGVSGAQWTKAYYDIGLYEPPYEGSKSWEKARNNTETFTIPVRNAKEAYVFHWKYYAVDRVACEILPDGSGIKVTTGSFSPFAVVYRDDQDEDVAGSSSSPPNTGDNSQLALWLALAGMSLAGMVLISRRRKRA